MIFHGDPKELTVSHLKSFDKSDRKTRSIKDLLPSRICIGMDMSRMFKGEAMIEVKQN